MVESTKTNILASIYWSVLSRWGSKFIGMITTIILARLLAPSDFGVIAMAMLALGLLDALSQAGLNLYLLRIKENQTYLYNTVWTAGILQGIIISIPLIVFAPTISNFYQQANLEPVIVCLAAIRLLQSFSNVGLLIAQKHLNFKLDFSVTLYSRIVYMLVTISLAFYLKSYWAIVLGHFTFTICTVLLSYVMHEYRPRLQLSGWRDIFQYSKSTVPLSIGRYLNNQGDALVVGRVASADFLGIYNVSINLASMFSKELLIPVIRGVLPNLSLIQNEANFKHRLISVFALSVYIFLPVGFGLSLVSEEFILVFLGAKWSLAIPLMTWFSLYAMVAGILMFFSEQFLVILEKESLSNKLMWFRNAMLIVTIIVNLSFFDIYSLPKHLFIAICLSFPIVLTILCKALSISLLNVITSWVRPVCAVVFMCLTISYFPILQIPVIAILALKVVSGFVVYTLAIVVLYKLFGDPVASIESMLYNKLIGDRISSNSTTN
ncbi:oligosaccharide flippase family protein [Aliiglaciecola sp. 2_MG-2023]|uniref:oligosaccharide flippase family protein n=1 Tax=unclassified Aliiglaciecola TaxID=2593648 RepID=UPI0026E36D68|nr:MULTISPECIES: oligosaccharide flippase family protein [unclassified Aliiglaciecola]MDO6709187.1 oligosaccharide flippase family protein [Aliiglaciecola sp. 2_MG-2023]MDO6750335.1 oligosaccharide flippase family protein [Aliiglaciecola sp. 1_MG-2023]